MAFVLPPLPYPKNALSPSISEQTLEFHYEKHHRGYVDKLNQLIKGTALENSSLESLIREQTGKIYNLAAQAWNHTFYWNSMSPNGGGEPKSKSKTADAINKSFGSFETFKNKFTDEANNHFGSGWIWLVRDDQNNLSIYPGHDAHCPLSEKKTPVLTCDVWEHAYYIDYKNNRASYIDAWWKVVNWDFVEKNMA
ncbi:superoxide dismutase [Fe]-like [Schistocerca gregaria]|uniref:superoxide dismutase [Fe]-like n=1 Tax=Schistocerca gregaria TaxID=7010 RepID=UPI00211F03A2|nr:superoxide dismutase [Fe]-like [Schistocerca gregaria]